MPASLENLAVATGLEKVSFHFNPREGQCQRISNYRMTALISHASKIMLKILQSSLQKYMNQELLNVQAVFQSGRGTRNQIASICWIMEKAKECSKLSKPVFSSMWTVNFQMFKLDLEEVEEPELKLPISIAS